MMDRQINIFIISFILVGPIITLTSFLVDGLYFTFYLFPVTINSLTFSIDQEGYKELKMVALIVPLFFVKILVMGAVCLMRLFMHRDMTKLLSRFYVLILVISVAKFVGYIIYIPDNGWHFVAGLIGTTSLATGLIWVIKKQRTTRVAVHNPSLKN